MIDYIYDRFVLFCDSCYKTIGCDTFSDCLDYMSDNDWSSTNLGGGDWYNRCKKCSLENITDEFDFEED